LFRPARILVPTDMSDDSDIAIRRAFDIAQTFQSEVFVLHVITDPVKQCAVDYCMSEEMLKELQSRMLESARDRLWEQLAKFTSMGVSPINANIRTGSPHDEILKEAEDRAADLIVIGTFGKTGLGRHFMGSVVRHVLSGAKCSVLMVK